MNNYFHSVRLDTDKCKGCVNCIKYCPTEAIRIRNGKAQITESRCIDCGECIRRCPNHAKTAFTDTMECLIDYEWNIVLPAPALYAQFPANVSTERILNALISLGFDEVFEVALAAEIISDAVHNYLQTTTDKGPFISSACPAVVRLIQVKFPELIDHIVPIDSPVALAGRIARFGASRRLNLPLGKIGVWFITPCPAKVTAIRQPVDLAESHITGAIGISAIYGDLLKALQQENNSGVQRKASGRGIGWAMSGGETKAEASLNALSVDGIRRVNELLEQVELEKLNDIQFLECSACAGGCIGGPLTVENRFVAEKNLQQRLEHIELYDDTGVDKTIIDFNPEDYCVTRYKIEPRSIMVLDADIGRAIVKMEQLEETLASLPGLDCGSCGSPSCRALAEDIVQGRASETDCVFKLRERVKALAEKMVDLAQKLPPSLTKNTKD